MNYEKLYESEIIKLYKFTKKLSKGVPNLSGTKFPATEYFAIYNHPDIPQVVVFPVLNTLRKYKITKADIKNLNNLSVVDAWQFLMEFYKCECAGALATGDVNHDIDMIKTDKEYLDELWDLNNK